MSEISFKINKINFHKVSQQRCEMSLHPPPARSHRLYPCPPPPGRQPGGPSPCQGLAPAVDFVSDHNALLEITSRHRGCRIPRVAVRSPEELVLRPQRGDAAGTHLGLTHTFSHWSWDFPRHPCCHPFPEEKESKKKSLEQAGRIPGLRRDSAVTLRAATSNWCLLLPFSLI